MRKWLAGFVFVIGAIVWSIAKQLTDNRLGVIPTLIIVGPFIYLAMRLWRSNRQSEADRRASVEEGLERAAVNPKLSEEKRAEAKRILEEMRSSP